ncbi:MAG: 30S ribosomal protein S12 methylthiotransferase RimO [Nitrospirae bacterium]|nr:MAG: 30S ribosomal protein S12 methylthiotransferase RimO [Nitrospirota bacterium]
MKVHITTLGCPKNTVDSGHLSRAFHAEGFEIADDERGADILLINTCGFIKDAKEESVEEILRISKLKKGGKKLVVFGCLAKRYDAELRCEIPEIDALFGVGEDARIIEYCKQTTTTRGEGHGARGDSKKALVFSKAGETAHPAPYAYLKIADGCDKKCTFCAIPSIRGRFKSVSPEAVVQEAKEYVEKGVKELILVAQDITNFGKDMKKHTLVSLLNDLISIKGDFFIRLLYLYPTEITGELLKLIAVSDKIQKYLDIPLQHSEDKMLRLMGRRGTRKDYIKLIRQIRKTIPGVALRTTFIVGFPGETEDDFNGLVDFIEELRFDRLGVFKYSKEDGTPAARLTPNVPEKIKDRRLDEIMTRQAVISLEKNKELAGRTYRAIIDEVDRDAAIARLYSHAPEIDGVVIIEKPERQLRPASIVDVEITEAYDYDLKGRVV